MLGHYSTSLSRQDLKDYFITGCKTQNELAIGMEWEKIGIYRDTGEAIHYSGDRGVRAIFEALIQKYSWKPVLSSAGLPIALEKGERSITLEPGGQIELSGQKAAHMENNAKEVLSHLREIKMVSEPLGIVWLGLGAQPFSVAEEIEWVPKERYAIMRQKLAGKGSLTFSMMKETASVQISLDYTSEPDAAQKFRLSMALVPLLTAIFANSPVEGGRRTEFYSRRAWIWRNTAPERTGVLWKALEGPFGFDDYVEYALKVPILFLQRDGQWLAPENITFEEFLEKGWRGLHAEAGDWELHLSSIFTETRLKKYIEIRSIDCQTPALGLAAATFIKGLFYHGPSRQSAWDLLKNWSIQERKRLVEETPRLALKTKIGSRDLLETAKALLALAETGVLPEEKKFLEPLKNLLNAGRCPAETLLGCIGEAKEKKDVLARLIHCCEI